MVEIREAPTGYCTQFFVKKFRNIPSWWKIIFLKENLDRPEGNDSCLPSAEHTS